MKSFGERNYYNILEIAPTAQPHEIRRAYEKARATYSATSDALYSIFTAEEAGELLKLVEEAYAVLGNAQLRKAYDTQVLTHAEPEQATNRGFHHPPISSSAAPSLEPEEMAVDVSHLGHTPMGSYQIDPDFESAIAQQDVFDGSFLRKVREYKEVTLSHLSQVTRINIFYLKAIEENDFTSLPAPVFVRGFIVQIAKALKLEQERVAKSYMKYFKDSLGK